MKKLILALSITISLLFVRCSNEVDVIGIWKDIPVVYGIVDLSDSINYIRVERAYLPPNQSALEVARIPDSLYFDTSEVEVTMYYLLNGDTFPTLPLEFVDLNNEGITRDSGIFAESPAYAYKLRGQYNRPLFLKIDNKKTNKVFTAYTEMVIPSNALLYTTPSYYFIPYKPLTWVEISNTGDTAYSTLLVEMTNNGFASIYDYKFRFYYTEYQVDNNNNIIPGTENEKSIVWKASSDFIPLSPSQNEQSFNGESFFRYLAGNLSDVTNTNVRRCAGYIEVFIDGGSQSLKEYIIARQANEGFVGGLYPADAYSNVTNGYGVFATKGRLERKDRSTDPRLMQMSSLTIFHLSSSTITAKLGFQENACY